MEISEKDKAELLALSRSESMRQDMMAVAANRHNPFILDGEFCLDRVVEFLTQYNEFLGHPIKPRRPFIEKNMKL